MDFGTWIVVIVVLGVLIAVGDFMLKSKARKNMAEYLTSIADFTATQTIMGEDGNAGLAIDEQRSKVCLIDHSQPEIVARVVSYKDVLSSEIFEDGVTVTKTNRSSQVGGALIGGLALGGVGAIIGGLSGSSSTSGKVKRIDLRLTVNDTAKPLHDVCFMDMEFKRGSLVYNQAMEQVRHWHGVISVLIKKADSEDTAIGSGAAGERLNEVAQSSSIADELKKLVDLRDSGVLKPEEFEGQKARLLGL